MRGDRRQSRWGGLLSVPTAAVSCVPPVTAGCVAEEGRRHRTPLTGPVADTRDGTIQSQSLPLCTPSNAPHSCGATEAFVRVCLSTLDCKGRSKMKCATSPALGTGEETPPSLTGCPWLPLTRHREKSCFWQTQDISF